MWFDAQAELTKLGGGSESDTCPPATLATTATTRSRVAIVADVATPPAATATPIQRISSNARKVTTPPHSKQEPFPYGTACNLGDAPRTWTGRIVSLDEWRRLTEWEKHGPNGQHWNCITKRWEQKDRRSENEG